MFQFTNNIDFVIAALAILFTLYVVSKKKFSGITAANRIFYQMILCAIITCVMDILMNIAVSYPDIVPTFVYMLLRLLFNCGTSMIAYLGYRYARMYQFDNKSRRLHVLDLITRIIFVSYVVLSVVNIFTGVISRIDADGTYHQGPLFMVNTVAPALIFAMVLVVLAIGRNEYTKKQRYSIIAYFAITFAFVILELLSGNKILLTLFGIALSLTVIQQSLVTPEFLELEAALEEQKRISKEAKEAREEAEEANNAKSSFLARMSHEIRTPLNAVIGFNSIIMKESLDEGIKQYAKDAKLAGETLLGLINDILDFSKIESGKLTLIDDEYSTAKLIKEEYLLFDLKAQEKGLKLIFDVDENIPSELYGDCIRIKQILTNILSNSIKYTQAGEIRFAVKCISKSNNTADIKYEISDTGMGIKEENLSKLFEAFERIEEKRNRNIEGTGLGVNICVQLLNMMGSSLKVDSVYGEGSTFSFILTQKIINDAPMGDFRILNIDDAHEENERALINSPDSRILIVDDTIVNLKVLKGLLKSTDIKIDEANSGKKALELTAKVKYDLIFMDHLMPEMDGIEAMRLIKEQADGKNIDTPIIALTANALKGAYEEYKAYGFKDALFKPVKLAEINEKLWTYLG
ncbi:MAG: response regulator [Lachnospiraceae bacterium]|nr:response regulator [Lachnospiraceae bacterium]